jgi:hypothetical protein
MSGALRHKAAPAVRVRHDGDFKAEAASCCAERKRRAMSMINFGRAKRALTAHASIVVSRSEMM